MSNPTRVIISGGVFLFIIVLCAVGYYIWQQSQESKSKTQRFENAFDTTSDFDGGRTSGEIYDKAVEQLRRDKSISSFPLLDNILRALFKDRLKGIILLIQQTGVSIKAGEFLIFCALIGVVGAIGINIALGIPLVGAAAGFFPVMILHFLKAKRISKFVSQMPPALDMMNADLRAGLDVQQVFAHVAQELSPPISEEFQRIVAEINLGVPTDEAILNLAERIDTVDVQLLCTGIIINRELGGNLSELVSNVCATVRERFRLQGVIKALTAESSASANLMMGMPIALFFILNFLAPATYNSFTEEPLGQMILKGCAVSMTIGFVAMKQMTKIEG